jgi:hypothetical protein
MTISEVQELPDVATLRRWAREHHSPITYLGPTLERRAVYAAADGPVARVARTTDLDEHPLPLIWHSPLERLDEALARPESRTP